MHTYFHCHCHRPSKTQF